MKHRGMLAPINSVKHYVHRQNTLVASGVVLNHNMVNAAIAPATATSATVKEGAIVKSIFYEYWVLSDGATATTTQFNFMIEKLPNLAPSITAAQMINLTAYPNKKNVMFTSQGVIAGEDTNSVPLIRGWLLVPKGKQRFGLSDRLNVNFTATGQGIRICGISIYKEYI